MDIQINLRDNKKIYMENIVTFYHSNLIDIGGVLSVTTHTDDLKGKTEKFALDQIESFHIVVEPYKNKKIWI